MCVRQEEFVVEPIVEPTGETDEEKTDGWPKIPALFLFSFCVTLLSLLKVTN